MRLRQLLPVASLGLLTALLAHTAGYGSDHVAGGTHHVALDLVALGGVGGFVVVVAVLAWLGASRYADGSVLAASLRPILPTFSSLLLSATGWFVVIESIEPEHAVHAPLALIAFCLAVATTLVACAMAWLVRTIATIVVAIAGTGCTLQPITYSRRFERCSSARRSDFVYRRFARPPPGAMLPV